MAMGGCLGRVEGKSQWARGWKAQEIMYNVAVKVWNTGTLFFLTWRMCCFDVVVYGIALPLRRRSEVCQCLTVGEFLGR